MSQAAKRFIGLDIHKAYMVVGAIDREQKILFGPQHVFYKDFDTWITESLRESDHLVFEACNNAWTLHDRLSPHVEDITVAHAAQVKLIAHSMVKTDKRDALTLARLLAARLIPSVWVPPESVRELRALIHQRHELIEQRSATKSRLRALLNRYNIQAPGSNLEAQCYRDWWDNLGLPNAEHFIAHQNLALLDHLEAAIRTLEVELAQQSVSDEWCDSVTRLQQLPGMALINSMTVLSAIGDIARFPGAKQLVGYAGLGTRIRSSGDTHRSGRITKQGRVELRTTMVEAAWIAVQHDDFWREQFEAIAQRRGRGKAIVAVARKMLATIWHLLTKKEANRYADPAAIARRLMRWGAYYSVAVSLGLRRIDFVRRELDRLQIGHTLESVNFSGRVNMLPPPGSVPIA